jgi:hypothetical protein
VQHATRRERHRSATRSRPEVLFIAGSINQTTQLHAVAARLPECSAHFTPFYGDRTVSAMQRLGLLEATIAGDKRAGWCLDYLNSHGLDIDLYGRGGKYDLVVTCTDLLVPRNVRYAPVVVVQEGLLDPLGTMARLCRRFAWLPRWFAGTALTGLSGLYDRMCVASPGYRDRLIAQGADPARVVVTGIPNFDDCARYCDNAFPHRGYFLVCTSDARETYKRDDRAALVRRAMRLASGRKVVFKLHPNENHRRATAEILAIAPDALVFSRGSAEEMIANAEAVLVQWSSTVFVALALGKEVHATFPLDEVRELQPVQNGGASAANIARVCRDLLGLASPSREDDAPRGPATAAALAPAPLELAGA